MSRLCVLLLPIAACAAPVAPPTAPPAPPQRAAPPAPPAPPVQIATGECVWSTGQLLFDRPGLWTMYRDGVAAPATGNASLGLLLDDVHDAAAAVFYNGQVQPPFKFSLLPKVSDESEWRDPSNLGNGLAVMLLKDETPYRRGDTLPIGSGRGVIRDGTGYAVELALDGSSELRITDGLGEVLASRPFAPAYTNSNSVMSIDISVADDGITVASGSTELLAWHGKVDHRYGGLAISAATSDREGYHSIADVWLSPEPPLSPGVTICHDDTPGLE